MDDITVLGVGNTIMQDDGFGVHVIEKMQEMKWPDNIKFLDGGTLGMGLLPYLEGTTRLLIVDAISADGKAGDFFSFAGEEVNAYFSHKISVHDLGLNDLLAALSITNKPIKETIIMGVKPAVVDLGVSMTKNIEAKIDETVEKIIIQLKKWHVQPII